MHATLAHWNVLPAGAKIDEVAKTGLRVKKVLNSESDPLEAMVGYCEDHPPDLLVMTIQGHRDFLDALRGSTTERVLRAAHCPVLAMPGRAA